MEKSTIPMRKIKELCSYQRLGEREALEECIKRYTEPYNPYEDE